MARVRFGECDFDYPSDELEPLRDSGDLIDDVAALHERLAEDGYLYLPGLLDRDEVLAARQHILEYMAEHEGLEPDSRPLDGVMGQYGKPVPMMGKPPITHSEPMRRVLESPRLFDFYERLHAEPAMTFDYKWLRAVGNEECTGAHMDFVYMGRGSQRLMTAWVPFDDIPVEKGTLAVLPGTNHLPGYEKLRNTYGKCDVDRDHIQGWFTKNPRELINNFGGTWQTSPVRAGDIITFGMHLMHASTTNVTDQWRVSCDVRFQPKADPVDERWVGKEPKAHYAWNHKAEPKVPIEQSRAEWGL